MERDRWILKHFNFLQAHITQAKLATSTTVNPPASESEEDEEDNSQQTTPLPGTSSQQDIPKPSQSSTRTKSTSKTETATLTSLQRRVDESKKLMEWIEAMMEEAQDSGSAQMLYGVCLAQMVPQITSSLIQDHLQAVVCIDNAIF